MRRAPNWRTISIRSVCIRQNGSSTFPDRWRETYFDMMPIHKELRGRDFPTTVNYLKVTLCNVYDEFVRQADLKALAAALDRQAG